MPFAISRIRKKHIKLELKDVLFLILLGFLNACISMNLMQIALNYLTAHSAAMIFSTNPLFVSVLAAFILKEKFTVSKGAALFLGLMGMGIAMLNIVTFQQDTLIFGLLFQITSTIVFSLYTVCGKRIALKTGSLVLTSLASLFGSITVLPVVFLAGETPFILDWQANWMQIFILSVGITGIAYLLFFKALEGMDTGLGSMSFFAKPIISLILSAIVLGEIIEINFIAGLILVSAGIYVLYRGQRKLSATNGKSAVKHCE